jgi:flagellar biosynthesis chaperone FliJ
MIKYKLASKNQQYIPQKKKKNDEAMDRISQYTIDFQILIYSFQSKALYSYVLILIYTENEWIVLCISIALIRHLDIKKKSVRTFKLKEKSVRAVLLKYMSNIKNISSLLHTYFSSLNNNLKQKGIIQ